MKGVGTMDVNLVLHRRKLLEVIGRHHKLRMLPHSVDVIIFTHTHTHTHTQSGESALMKASYCGHVKTVEVLIEHEAILDLKTAKGLTALTYSVLHQHSDIVSRLVLAGANTRVKDEVLYSILLPLNQHPL